jgi:hypothetical protein
LIHSDVHRATAVASINPFSTRTFMTSHLYHSLVHSESCSMYRPRPFELTTAFNYTKNRERHPASIMHDRLSARWSRDADPPPSALSDLKFSTFGIWELLRILKVATRIHMHSSRTCKTGVWHVFIFPQDCINLNQRRSWTPSLSCIVNMSTNTPATTYAPMPEPIRQGLTVVVLTNIY